MARYLARRVILLLLVQLGALCIVFVAIRSVPGNPAELMLGADRTPEDVAILMREWGYDRSLPEQFVRYVANVAQGDLGRSTSSRRPVIAELQERLSTTAVLALLALVLGVTLGAVGGIVAAIYRGSLVDRGVTVLALSGISVPSFWTALVLVTVFAVGLGWLPAIGSGTPRHLVLPVVTLMLEPLAITARQTRSAMLEVLGEDYLRTARAKGLGQGPLLIRHAFPNAMIVIVTVVGLSFGHLLGGSIIVESVFGLAGIGSFTIGAIAARDYPVLQGCVLLFAFTFGAVNLVVDLVYAWLDPRVRVG